jgi:hypothetical protein
MEENINERQPQWKMTSMNLDLEERQPKQKMLMEDDVIRRPHWKMT